MTSSLSVGHVNLARGYRGGERQTELLIREFAERGLEQRLVVRAEGELADRMSGVERLRIEVVAWPFLHATGVLRGCDVVHAHDGKAPAFCALASRRLGVPFVVTRRIQRPPGRGSLWAYRAASRVVGLSTGVADGLGAATGRSDVRIIPSAHSRLSVDAGEVERIRERYSGRFLVICAAQLVPGQKGHEHLIEAARGLESRGVPMHVLLLGRGGGEPLFRTLAAGLDSVEFGGFVENLGDFLAAADALVHPSIHEGLGSVILDAFAAGLPVVASDIPGIRDLVRDDDNGLLVPPADAASLGAAVERIVGDESLRTRLGEAAGRSAADYTPERMADRYLAVYRECVA